MSRSRRLQDDTSNRKRAERAGRRAEMLCQFWLRLKGYRILATRYKSPAGEIDIIALRGKMLIAIEVKARSNRTDALYAVSSDQQRRIARALESYAGIIGHSGDLRLDLMIVGTCGRIEHMKNAWQAH